MRNIDQTTIRSKQPPGNVAAREEVTPPSPQGGADVMGVGGAGGGG